MTKKTNNIRKCIFSNQKLSKTNLIRLVIINHQAIIDPTFKMNGRGYYLINDITWIKAHLNAQKLNKRLNITNGQTLYEALINL